MSAAWDDSLKRGAHPAPSVLSPPYKVKSKIGKENSSTCIHRLSQRLTFSVRHHFVLGADSRQNLSLETFFFPPLGFFFIIEKSYVVLYKI